MADSEDEETHQEAQISVSQAKTMLQYGRNSEKAMASLTLDFSHWKSPEAIEFAGDALRSNTRIEHFEIDLRGNPHDIEENCMDDILYFVVNNPSLKSLEVRGCSGEAQELSKLLMEAAGGNHAIDAICYGGRFDEPASCLPSNWEPITTCRELTLYGFSEDLEWPETHSIEILRLGKSDDQSCYDYQTNLSAFLKKLTKCAGSKKIQCLDIDSWSPTLPTFLGCPNSCIRELELYSLDFSHSHYGCSAIDGLLWGLMQSKTTTTLDLDSCEFDELATEKLANALQSNWLPVKHLTIFSDEPFLTGEAVRDLFACKCLDTLGLKTDDEDVDADGEFLRQGLEQCSLSEARLTTSMIESLCPTLETVLSTKSLRKLELSNCRFRAEDLGCLVSLIQDESCHLLELAMVNYYWVEDDPSLIESTIFGAIEGKKSNLEKLIWGVLTEGELAAVTDAMSESLEKIDKLEALEISSSSRLSPERSTAIAHAMSTNWSLGKLILVVSFDTHPEPMGSSRLQRMLHEYSQRNQMKKEVFSPAFAHLKKRECIETLARAWSLPDCLNLAFWLLQRVPHHFFNTDKP